MVCLGMKGSAKSTLNVGTGYLPCPLFFFLIFIFVNEIRYRCGILKKDKALPIVFGVHSNGCFLEKRSFKHTLLLKQANRSNADSISHLLKLWTHWQRRINCHQKYHHFKRRLDGNWRQSICRRESTTRNDNQRALKSFSPDTPKCSRMKEIPFILS